MPYTIILLEAADKEFSEAAAWYEEQSAGLGDRFIHVIQNKLALIAQFPDRYPKRKGNFREAVVKTFPYLIIYTVYKKDQIVTVSAIFHASRNPKRKYRK